MLRLNCSEQEFCEETASSWLRPRQGSRTQTDGVPTGASEARAGGGLAEEDTQRDMGSENMTETDTDIQGV